MTCIDVIDSYPCPHRLSYDKAEICLLVLTRMWTIIIAKRRVTHQHPPRVN